VAGSPVPGRSSIHRARAACTRTSPTPSLRTGGAPTTARTSTGSSGSRRRTIPATSSGSNSRYRPPNRWPEKRAWEAEDSRSPSLKREIVGSAEHCPLGVTRLLHRRVEQASPDKRRSLPPWTRSATRLAPARPVHRHGVGGAYGLERTGVGDVACAMREKRQEFSHRRRCWVEARGTVPADSTPLLFRAGSGAVVSTALPSDVGLAAADPGAFDNAEIIESVHAPSRAGRLAGQVVGSFHGVDRARPHRNPTRSAPTSFIGS